MLFNAVTQKRSDLCFFTELNNSLKNIDVCFQMHAVGAAHISLAKLREAYASSCRRFQLMMTNLKTTLKNVWSYGIRSLDINLFERAYLLR